MLLLAPGSTKPTYALLCAQSEWSNQELHFRAPFMDIQVGNYAETVGQHHRKIFPGISSGN